MRNSALTTIAPTGSISMLLDCSSGVEPFFALAYSKEVMSGQKLSYVNPYLERELKRIGLYNDEIIKEIEKTGSIQHIENIPREIKKYDREYRIKNIEKIRKYQREYQRKNILKRLERLGIEDLSRSGLLAL